jgi:hypothetical protein
MYMLEYVCVLESGFISYSLLAGGNANTHSNSKHKNQGRAWYLNKKIRYNKNNTTLNKKTRVRFNFFLLALDKLFSNIH